MTSNMCGTLCALCWRSATFGAKLAAAQVEPQLGNKTLGRKEFWEGSTPTKAIESSRIWRKRVGVEPTIHPAKGRIAGLEDREDHRTPCASVDLDENDNTRVNEQSRPAPGLTEIARYR